MIFARHKAEYDGFISYRRSSGGHLVFHLHRTLEALGRPWYRLQALRIFLDNRDVDVGDVLDLRVKTAIGRSRKFVVVASDDVANSDWVNSETAHWVGISGDAPLLALASGALAWSSREQSWAADPDHLLPRTLPRSSLEEQVFADFSWGDWGSVESAREAASDPRFMATCLALAAPLHGRTLREMAAKISRERRRAIMVVAITILSVLSLLFMVASLLWARARDRVQSAAEAHFRAGQAQASAGDFEGALREFDRCLELGARDPLAARIAKVDAYSALLNREAVISEVRGLAEVSADSPHAAKITLMRGDYRVEKGGDIEHALSLLREARLMGLSPGDDAYASALLSRSLSKALNALDKALEHQPGHRRAWEQRALLLAVVGSAEDIRDCRTAMASRYPKDIVRISLLDALLAIRSGELSRIDSQLSGLDGVATDAEVRTLTRVLEWEALLSNVSRFSFDERGALKWPLSVFDTCVVAGQVFVLLRNIAQSSSSDLVSLTAPFSLLEYLRDLVAVMDGVPEASNFVSRFRSLYAGRSLPYFLRVRDEDISDVLARHSEDAMFQVFEGMIRCDKGQFEEAGNLFGLAGRGEGPLLLRRIAQICAVEMFMMARFRAPDKDRAIELRDRVGVELSKLVALPRLMAGDLDFAAERAARAGQRGIVRLCVARLRRDFPGEPYAVGPEAWLAFQDGAWSRAVALFDEFHSTRRPVAANVRLRDIAWNRVGTIGRFGSEVPKELYGIEKSKGRGANKGFAEQVFLLRDRVIQWLHQLSRPR